MLFTLGAILCALESALGNTYSCYAGSFLVTSSAFYYTTNLLFSLIQFFSETKIGQIILSSFLWSCIYFMAYGYQILMNGNVYCRLKPIIFTKMWNDVHEQEMSKLVSYHYGDQDQLEDIDDIFTSEKKPLQLSVTYNHDSKKFMFVPNSIDTINQEPSSEIEMTVPNEMHDENKVINEFTQEKVENNKNENSERQEIVSREIMQESEVIDELIPEKIEEKYHEKIEENENALNKNLEYHEKIEENENSLNPKSHKKIEENEENKNALNQDYREKIEENEENENALNKNLEYHEKIEENENSLNPEFHKKIEENEENKNELNQDYHEKIEENDENENALNKNLEYHEKIEEKIEGNEENENALNQEYHEKIEENEENENRMNKNSIKDREINDGTQVTRVEKNGDTTIYANPDSTESLESEPDSGAYQVDVDEKEANTLPNETLLNSDIDTQSKSNMNEKEVDLKPNSVITKPVVYEPFTEIHVAPPSELFLADAILQLDQEIEQITEYEKSAIAEIKEKEAKDERDQEYEFMKSIQCGLKRQIHILNYQKLQYEIQQKENALSPVIIII
ncbi:9021_t:CDS:2 [Diversispora eburnea]|uniref:9021_t:CDS:1 n=1 Tax=Diversispora eburnea TaxID=1213867 RepID=A0A9N8YP42_9GLOM|nr:9021_t:CDS:2 [Diversispora eburnea]